MKKSTLVSSATISLLILLSSGFASAKPQTDGPTLIKKLSKNGAGWGDMSASLDMQVQTKKKSLKRAMRIKAKEVPGAGSHSLIVFDSPADIRGTALLSLAGDDGQQYLYLPATKRARRISGGSKTGAFFGSEFSYEDITGLTPAQHEWKVIGEAPCGQATCTQLEARPRYKGSLYSRRVLLVDEKENRVVNVEFFDKKNVHLKTLSYSGFRKYKKKYWRADKWQMKNVQTNASTTLNFSKYKFQTGLPTSQFTKSALSNLR